MQSEDSIFVMTEAASDMSVMASFDLYKEAQTVAFDGE
jgi:hypothetical protein